MDRRGQGGGELRVHGLHDVVGHQHRGVSGLDSRLERQEVAALKGLQAPGVQGDAGVGVRVVPVAGEVLQNAADPALPHGRDHIGDIVRGGRRVLAQGPVEDEVAGVRGHVRHRGQVHVDAQGQQGGILFPGVGGKGVALAGGGEQQLLGGGEGPVKEIGIPAGPGDGAPLLVGADQQGDAGVGGRGVLIAGDGPCHLFLCQPGAAGVLEVPAKEDVAPQVIGAHVRGGLRLRHPDEEQLAHLLLQRQGGEQVLDFRRGQLLRRGLRRRLGLLGGGRFPGGGRRGLRLFAAGGEGQQGHGGQECRKKTFHKCSFRNDKWGYCTTSGRKKKEPEGGTHWGGFGRDGGLPQCAPLGEEFTGGR